MKDPNKQLFAVLIALTAIFCILAEKSSYDTVLEIYPETITDKNCAFGAVRIEGELFHIGTDACKLLPEVGDTATDILMLAVFQTSTFGIPKTTETLIVYKGEN